eukprot:g1887.t1
MDAGEIVAVAQPAAITTTNPNADIAKKQTIHKTIMYDKEKVEAQYSIETTIYLAIDMILDAFCLGWLNGESWGHGRIFSSALTGQTVKLATEMKLNAYGLACIPAFLFGNLTFALVGPTILCAGVKGDWGMSLHEETHFRRFVFKSLLEIIYIIVTISINLDESLANHFIVVMSFAAGITNGFHSRNFGQATAFMTGRVATIGTELGLFFRQDGSHNRTILVRNVVVYCSFLLGGFATRAATIVALAWPFHLKYIFEMLCLLKKK